ncbi:SMEK domain-containing protein [Pontibacter kalidii]|uniref:SMEK domain-containing protein n=1 Tax=Pontibacter kalidii TaxID=2592049 RepID=UPI002250D82A|nr:SMEK domain-containing protein [Pontibacter kalidii]
MNRNILLTSIQQSLARFKAEIEIATANSEYNLHLHSENVLIPLLNEVFDVNLLNGNYEEKNLSAVDLVDYKNRIAFQVTSTSSITKIKNTIQQFIKDKRYEQFDMLYFFILTEKQNSYNSDSIDTLINSHFSFDADEHIIDNISFYKRIQKINNVEKIRRIEKSLSSEFTDEKIDQRKEQLQYFDIQKLQSEKVYFNFLELSIPSTIYYSDLDIDTKLLKARITNRRKKGLGRKSRHISDRDLVKEAINSYDKDGNKYCQDWIVSENKLFTFRNLGDDTEILSKLVTNQVEEIDSNEFYELNEDYKKRFVSLLNFSLRERFAEKKFEWVEKEELYRYKAGKLAKSVKIEWTKDKKKSERQVIYERWDKDKNHIICFRHLAFTTSLRNFEGKWYLAIRPTWSFTSDGYKRSRFSEDYLTGIKRLEANKSVFSDFKFIGTHLSETKNENTLFSTLTTPYSLIIHSPVFAKFNPVINDEDWKPIREKKSDDNQLEVWE